MGGCRGEEGGGGGGRRGGGVGSSLHVLLYLSHHLHQGKDNEHLNMN